MRCEACNDTGVHHVHDEHSTFSKSGLPFGWVQRCDECCRYGNDLDAVNALRVKLGLNPMNGYPFSVLDRADEDLRQSFYVRVGFDHGELSDAVGLEELAVTVAVERDCSIASVNEMLVALRRGSESALVEMGYEEPEVTSLFVLDCSPAEALV